MKKANFVAYNQNYLGFIIIEDMSDLIDYFNERLYGIQKESAVTIVQRDKARNKGQEVSHTTDVITRGVEFITDRNGKGCLYNQAVIMADVQQNMVDAIHRGYRLSINPYNGVSYMTIPHDVVLEFIEVGKYTKDDIKVSRWPDGSHWYAKIGYIDVVVDGEHKWNARWEAQSKAEQFLKTL